MNLLTDLACQDQGGFDLLYLTELDPLWQDDELSFLLNPEAALFANRPRRPPARLTAWRRAPDFRLTTCSGARVARVPCYPLVGSTAHNTGGIDTSLLLTQRMASKLHGSWSPVIHLPVPRCVAPCRSLSCARGSTRHNSCIHGHAPTTRSRLAA